jgi:hypothetical protein
LLIVPKTGVEHLFEEIPDLAVTLGSHRLLDERVLLLDISRRVPLRSGNTHRLLDER